MTPSESTAAAAVEYYQCDIRLSIYEAALGAIQGVQFTNFAPDERQCDLLRETWNIGKALHERISSLPELELETLEALAELQNALDWVRDLL